MQLDKTSAAATGGSSQFTALARPCRDRGDSDDVLATIIRSVAAASVAGGPPRSGDTALALTRLARATFDAAVRRTLDDVSFRRPHLVDTSSCRRIRAAAADWSRAGVPLAATTRVIGAAVDAAADAATRTSDDTAVLVATMSTVVAVRRSLLADASAIFAEASALERTAPDRSPREQFVSAAVRGGVDIRRASDFDPPSPATATTDTDSLMSSLSSQSMSISVVLPACNEADGIDDCVRRLLNQKHPVDEIIVVDNNSTDETAALVRRLADEDPRVCLFSESRAGVAYARYAGFAAAHGDIIASIDSDTLVEPGWAAGIVAAFDHPEVVAGTGPLVMHDLPFQKRFARRAAAMSVRAQKALDAGKPLPIPALSGANSAIRRTAWLKIEDEVSCRTDLFEDLDRSILLRKRGYRIALLPGLHASVSGRRLLGGPRSFLRYAACGPRTYAFRGQYGMAAGSWIINTITFVRTMIKLPLNRAWDPTRQEFSLDRLRGRGLTLRDSPVG